MGYPRKFAEREEPFHLEPGLVHELVLLEILEALVLIGLRTIMLFYYIDKGQHMGVPR